MGSETDSFRRLYDAEIAYVVRTLTRLGVGAADLEDLAHDVFMIAYRKRGERDHRRPARPWLFGIAYRVVGNYLQKAHRRREVRGVDREAAAEQPSPEVLAGERERREALLAALAALDLDHRAAVVLFDLESHTAAEVAEILDIPENTVYSRVRAARIKLLEATRHLRGTR